MGCSIECFGVSKNLFRASIEPFGGFTGNGWNTVSRALLWKRELTVRVLQQTR